MTTEHKLPLETLQYGNKKANKSYYITSFLKNIVLLTTQYRNKYFCKKMLLPFIPVYFVEFLFPTLHTWRWKCNLNIAHYCEKDLTLACSSQTPDSLSGSQIITVLSIDADIIRIGCCMLPSTVQGKQLSYNLWEYDLKEFDHTEIQTH